MRHLAVALLMSCYDGSQGIEQVWVHGHFDLFSFRDLIGLASAAAPPERTAAIARAKAAAAPGRGHVPPRILHLKFFLVHTEVKTDNGLGEVEIYGQIRRHGKATGYVDMKTHSDATGKCYSGGLKWRAHRGAHVDYPPPA